MDGPLDDLDNDVYTSTAPSRMMYSPNMLRELRYSTLVSIPQGFVMNQHNVHHNATSMILPSSNSTVEEKKFINETSLNALEINNHQIKLLKTVSQPEITTQMRTKLRIFSETTSPTSPTKSLAEDIQETLNLDHYGFRVTGAQEEKKLDEKSMKNKLKRDNARLEKWRRMVPTLDESKIRPNAKLKDRVRKGVPESLRGRVWPILAEVQSLKRSNPHINYQELIRVENVPFIEDIQKDVPRTFPDHYFFNSEDKAGQKSLEKVLKAVSLVYKDMGYCQGLNYICAVLVMYCNDEEAFWIMISLMKNYDLLDYYKDLHQVNKQLAVLDELIKIQLPKLWIHLETHSIESIHFAVNWWMTLFTNASEIPFKIVVRIMDTMLLERQKVLFRTTLAILKIKEKEIMNLRGMDRILPCITKVFGGPIWEDEDLFFKVAFGIKLSRKEIENFSETKRMTGTSQLSSIRLDYYGHKEEIISEIVHPLRIVVVAFK